jgi:putative ABC transport system permease protein
VAGLLVLAMAGMFVGMARSYTSTIDNSPSQVIVVPPEWDSLFSNGNGQPRRIIPEIYVQSDVLEVQPLNFGWAQWSNFPAEGQTAKSDGVQIVSVEPTPGSVTLPTDFSPAIIDALQEPYAVVIDRSSLGKLGVKDGDNAKMNGITVKVRGTVQGYASMFNAFVFVSVQTAKLLHVYDDGPRVGALVVKIDDARKAPQVVQELNTLAKGQYKAWTRESFSLASQKSMLKQGGIVVMIGFAAVVGAFIGIVITWQTLQGAILANIKEFASLRALGVSMRSLRRIVMELSLWVGVAGLMLTVVLTGLVWVLGEAFGVPMAFPLFIDVPVGITLQLIAILSGGLTLRMLKKSQPADLLR